MKTKAKDFVEMEYTGTIKEDNILFDTTDEQLAKENDLFNENMSYGPTILCLGEGHTLKGLDEELIDKEPGKEYTIELSAEKAFGKKDPKLIQLIPTSKFSQQKIRPMPGLQLNIDGLMGMVKTVSGGRTLVDFNHPLAGKEVVYKVKINKIVTDDLEKVKAYLKVSLNLKDVDVKIEEGIAKASLKKELPKEAGEMLNKKITELVPDINKLELTGEGIKNK